MRDVAARLGYSHSMLSDWVQQQSYIQTLASDPRTKKKRSARSGRKAFWPIVIFFHEDI